MSEAGKTIVLPAQSQTSIWAQTPTYVSLVIDDQIAVSLPSHYKMERVHPVHHIHACSPQSNPIIPLLIFTPHVSINNPLLLLLLTCTRAILYSWLTHQYFFGDVGGNQTTQGKPTWPLGELAYCTQTVSSFRIKAISQELWDSSLR